MRSTRFLAAIAALAPAVAAAAGPTQGAARVPRWTEWHITGDDVRLTLDANGGARVEHAIRYRVVMGPLHQIELTGIEASARLGETATVVAEDGRELPAHVEPKGEGGALKVLVDEPKGLKRGSYTFRIHYDADLVGAKELVRDGAMWRLAWRTPALAEGYDAARVVVDAPAAPTEPRAIKTGALPDGRVPLDGEEGGEDGVISSLRRTAARDELELLRPHVGRGEAPLWCVRLDPKAFPGVHTPEMSAPPPPPVAEPSRVGAAGAALGLAAIALAFGLAVRAKKRSFRTACAAAASESRPLIPLPADAAALFAGVFGAAGIGLQLYGWPTWGAVLLAATMPFGLSRVPRDRRGARGPGHWLALRPGEAFPRPRRLPRLAAAGVCAGFGLIVYFSRYLAPEAPYLVALDALALLPLATSGCRIQIPPRAAESAPLLARAFDALKAVSSLKVVPWARLPRGGEVPDELRILAVPRAPVPGLVSIELGVGWMRTAAAWAARPQALVRVQDDSDAHARLTVAAPGARAVTGRKPEERVFVLAPALPGARAAAALVVRLAAELTDRRVTLGGYRGPERRLMRDEKTDRVPAAA